jgi:hypothetical protein
MGKVRIAKHTSVPDTQESYDFVYEYTYCDQCGSFNIGLSSALPSSIEKALSIIILVSFGAAAAIAFIATSVWLLGCLIGLVGLLAFIAFNFFTSRFRCAKCGNQRISSRNVLNYVENAESVIDVPESQLLKKHIGTYSSG